jgi:hypothetical protein
MVGYYEAHYSLPDTYFTYGILGVRSTLIFFSNHDKEEIPSSLPNLQINSLVPESCPVKKTELTHRGGGIRCTDHVTPSIHKSWH